MKRGEFPESEKHLVIKIEKEFAWFRYQMLSKSRKKIFESNKKIRFYSCIHEYFVYAGGIEEVHIKACLKCPDAIASLYRIYMEYEYLRCERREDIEELLNVLVREQEECSGKERTVP